MKFIQGFVAVHRVFVFNVGKILIVEFRKNTPGKMTERGTLYMII